MEINIPRDKEELIKYLNDYHLKYNKQDIDNYSNYILTMNVEKYNGSNITVEFNSMTGLIVFTEYTDGMYCAVVKNQIKFVISYIPYVWGILVSSTAKKFIWWNM